MAGIRGQASSVHHRPLSMGIVSRVRVWRNQTSLYYHGTRYMVQHDTLTYRWPSWGLQSSEGKSTAQIDDYVYIPGTASTTPTIAGCWVAGVAGWLLIVYFTGLQQQLPVRVQQSKGLYIRHARSMALLLLLLPHTAFFFLVDFRGKNWLKIGDKN